MYKIINMTYYNNIAMFSQINSYSMTSMYPHINCMCDICITFDSCLAVEYLAVDQLPVKKLSNYMVFRQQLQYTHTCTCYITLIRVHNCEVHGRVHPN